MTKLEYQQYQKSYQHFSGKMLRKHEQTTKKRLKKKRIRSAFTTNQLTMLEKTFSSYKYLTRQRRIEISQALNISERLSDQALRSDPGYYNYHYPPTGVGNGYELDYSSVSDSSTAPYNENETSYSNVSDLVKENVNKPPINTQILLATTKEANGTTCTSYNAEE
ncbi:unnamed protein product [Spodoptera exigua]|nr:unnamed protein product [Spodoptera exigua]